MDTKIASLIDAQYLTGLLQQSMESQSVEIREWQVHEIKGGLEYTSSVYRLKGSAIVDGSPQDWSLILKIVRPDDQADDPLGCHYWKREILAYESGMLQDLPGQIAAPTCYSIDKRPDGSVWLWLQDLQDDQEHPWPIERYAQVARHLGQFNGAYLAGRPLPNESWIARDWLRKYLNHAAPMVEFILHNPAHPTVQSMLPGNTISLTLACWDERDRMLSALDALPQTFCHQDAFGGNLFYRHGSVVALDWSYTGISPVGAELAPLIGAAFGLTKFPSSQAQELDQACFKGYLEGLHQAGYQADPRQVRLGFALSMFMRYTLGATIGELLPGLLNEATRSHWVEGMDVPEEKAGETDPGIASYYGSVAMEALKLLGLGTIVRVAGRTVGYTIRLAGKR